MARTRLGSPLKKDYTPKQPAAWHTNWPVEDFRLRKEQQQ
jgi:hypothetical protein